MTLDHIVMNWMCQLRKTDSDKWSAPDWSFRINISLFYFSNFWCLRSTSSETRTLHSLLMSQRLCPTPLFGGGLYICHTAFPHAWNTVWGHIILYSTAETTVHVKSSPSSICGLEWSFMCYMPSGRRGLWVSISSCFWSS